MSTQVTVEQVEQLAARLPPQDRLKLISRLSERLTEAISPPVTLDRLQESLRPLREQLVEHSVYHHIETLEDLRIFMEYHVFAVWDFMSLLKALQRHLTCVTVPWVPQGDRLSRRLINEIVLEEESDEKSEGEYISHFELYQAAMEQCGADTSKIDDFLDRIRQGESVSEALEKADVPKPAQTFVETTWQIVASGKAHSIAAAFALGREDLIPDMFRALVTDLQNRFPGQLTRLHNYLARHILLDEEHHTPMAKKMLAGLCDTDPSKWRECEETARVALNARIALWDGVVEQITTAKGKRLKKAAGTKQMKTYKELPADGGSDIIGQVTEQINRLQERLASIRHTVAIMSGKGGVGKSAITANLASALALRGCAVGIVDADINGPSIAKMMGVRHSPIDYGPDGVKPAVNPLGVKVISMDLFLTEDQTPVLWDAYTQKDAFTWRGTMEVTALRQFLSDTKWGTLDYLLIDLPPGADRLPNLVDLLPNLGGTVVVTIPSGVSQLVVKKSLAMAKNILNTPVIGILENMAAYVCADCGRAGDLFPSGHTEKMARQFDVPLLGKIPFDPRIANCADEGAIFVADYGETPAGRALIEMGEKIQAFFSAG